MRVNAMNAIDIKDLSVFYKGRHFYQPSKPVLRHISLNVEEGEIYGLIGSNGAGKSTLIKMLLGLIFPKHGTASIFGHAVSEAPIHQLIGYLPEHPTFYPFLTATALLEFYGKLFKMPAQLRREKIKKVLARVGLDNVPPQTILREYSKGMLQRLGIAQAILHDPKLLLLDEPMSGLDPMGRYEIAKLIQSLGSEGKTILFSSHILHDIEMLCDRVAIISKGELLQDSEIQSLLSTTIRGIELVLENTSTTQAELGLLPATCEVHGKRILVNLPDFVALSQVLIHVQKKQLNIIGINILRDSLEQYFVSEVNKGKRS